jgi:Uma2 family endonuclease
MTAVADARDSRVVIRCVSWGTYEALLRDRADSGPRMAYDQGVLEIMSPSLRHEKLKLVLHDLLRAFCGERRIGIAGAGSLTIKSMPRERGVEPDSCYYIENEARMRGRDTLDLSTDPPPDLAVEIDISRSSLDKLSIYASLGVPEVWSYDGQEIVIRILQPGGEHAVSSRSAALPDVPVSELGRFLGRLGTVNETELVESFRSWLREGSRGG